MCGIFGIVPPTSPELSGATFRDLASSLYTLSETRGKESSGAAVVDGGTIRVYKRPIPASEILRDDAFRGLLPGSGRSVDAWLGHSRLVTNGSEERHENNQPVIAADVVGVHNGIVVNDEALWTEHDDLERTSEVDTEVILALVRKHFATTRSIEGAVRAAFAEIYGNASIGLVFPDLDALVLATNNGSLYTFGTATPFVFASERFILESLAGDKRVGGLFEGREVVRMEPGTGLIVPFDGSPVQPFQLGEGAAPVVNGLARTPHRSVADVTPSAVRRRPRPAPDPAVLDATRRAEEAVLFRGSPAIDALRRCRRCILPETFPFIVFDDDGVCNYCHMYEPAVPLGPDVLEAEFARYRSGDHRQDCMMMFSGGRDSSYAIHLAVTEFGMNPVTYTYDWGMVTDIARRNISRVCSRLELENILVSADIRTKRDNIRRNVLAWLKRPDLGMIPLFTAGDKHYFYHANRITSQLGIDLTVLSANPFEQTHFKHGFCGVPPDSGHRPKMFDKARMMGYYASRFARNPRYLNRSLLDSVTAFASYFQIQHDYLRMFDYLPWQETEVDRVLLGEYDWETAPDTETTWRIGDGTAPFYNYIYYTVCGFSENDTFRSIQVREGRLTRDEALALADRDNQPRHASMKQYFELIGLGDRFVEIVETINRMPKLYADA